MNRSVIDRREEMSSIFNKREKGIVGTDVDRMECRFGDGQMRELSFDGSVFSITWENVIS